MKDGILANIELENRSKREEVKDAFEDLEALMVRAGEMVRLRLPRANRISDAADR
jgi:hypothetical protein